ncbi:MAG: biotin/lipoyl-binding protein [Pseudomonadota bacterium]
MKGNLFSESWFKVARLQVGLYGSVDVQKQVYRGEPWYVLRSAFGKGYFRITPEAYAFIAKLTPDHTVEEIWERSLAQDAGAAPTQDEVIQVLAELYSHNLLYFRNVPNAEHAFERRTEKKRKELISNFFSLISLKIPLWNPDPLLAALAPLNRFVWSTYGLLVWCLVVFLGGKAAIADLPLIADASQGMLAPANLFYLYLAAVGLKLFHELGHATVTKHLGGTVPTVGVMFLVLTPLPYIDASGSWFFKERRERMLVSGAGMLVDLFCAGLAAIVWAHTGDGILHSVAFNLMVLGSISSLFFNGNPLIRFDAYYLLADLLEIPNLFERARKQWLFWLERYLFGVEQGEPVARDPREAFWMGGFGLASFVYRCFLTVAILLIVADVSLMLGVVFLGVTLIVGVFLPLSRFLAYLTGSRRLAGVRARAVAVTAGALLLVAGLAGVHPWPRTVWAPGVVELSGYSRVYATTEGSLERIYCKNGDRVAQGQVLARLSSRDLDLDIEALRARMRMTLATKQKALHEAVADLKPLSERVALLEEQLGHLLRKKKELGVVARESGVFISPYIESYQGKWLKRQTQLGSLVAEGPARFSAIVSQEQAFDLFRSRHYTGRAKLYGSAGHSLQLTEVTVNPYQREELPSAALGWFGGGEVEVSTTDKTGKKVAESFFEVSGNLVPEGGAFAPQLLQGRTGVMRLSLPSESLAAQASRKVKQTIQKRYKL